MNISASPLASTLHILTPDPEPLPESPVVVKQCGHVFGRDCITRWMNSSNVCPMCRSEFYVPPSEEARVRNAEPAHDVDLGGFHDLLESIRELLIRDEDDERIFEDLMQRLQGQQERSANAEGMQSPESMVEDWVRRYYA
jgi:hypothetical protein